MTPHEAIRRIGFRSDFACLTGDFEARSSLFRGASRLSPSDDGSCDAQPLMVRLFQAGRRERYAPGSKGVKGLR